MLNNSDVLGKILKFNKFSTAIDQPKINFGTF